MVDRMFLVAACALLIVSCAPKSADILPPLETVPSVDLKKYTGTWYEIASYPQRFQRGCTDTKATYTLREDGKIGVLNSCRKEGKLDTATGKAWVVDTTTNAKLRVSFFWPFSGDYWIIDLGKEYDYAVVSHPNRKYLWILARSPQMDNALYNSILDRLRSKGFDTNKLNRTVQENRGDDPPTR